jgi:hypothetical protein
VFGAGFTIRLSLLSLLASHIGAGQISRVFGLVTTVEAVGGLAEDVALQQLFAWALLSSESWSGLPFLVSAVSFDTPPLARIIDTNASKDHICRISWRVCSFRIGF